MDLHKTRFLNSTRRVEVIYCQRWQTFQTTRINTLVSHCTLTSHHSGDDGLGKPDTLCHHNASLGIFSLAYLLHR